MVSAEKAVAGAAPRKNVGKRVSELAAGVEEEATELAKAAGKQAKAAADSGKEYAAEAIEGLASAAREVADRLKDGNPASDRAAGFARATAERMQEFSERLRDKDLRELADDARSIVRDNPAVTIGAAALIGFALARFLKGDSES